MFLKVNQVKKQYGLIEVLKGVDLSCELGTHLAIRGASGSGKSTLLHLIAGLEKGSGGHIEVGGIEVTKLNDEQLAHFRNHYIGLVFQFHYLLPTLNNFENMLLPSKIGGIKSPEVKDRILSLSQHLGIEHCLKKYPFELSGGEQQRVNIIRALSLAPKLILCDEPTGNLDSHNSKLVMDIILKLSKEFNSTLIVVTHDEGIATRFSQVKVMQDGILL